MKPSDIKRSPEKGVFATAKTTREIMDCINMMKKRIAANQRNFPMIKSLRATGFERMR